VLPGKRVLLIVSGGIAAYKTPELVRQLVKAGARVRCILTRGGAEFVTPLTLASLSGDTVYTDLFSLTDEHDMGHIQLSRDADVLLVAPASANTLAKMAHGQADNLATTVLLATDKPVLVAPAMNVRMWEHAATRSNIAILRERAVDVIGPEVGDMACGEVGEGRMSEPADIVAALDHFFTASTPLHGYSAIVTSGPTYEAIDPVRYIANRSSGKQGHAIAQALRELGARVSLVCGPVALPDPPGVVTVHVESARDMQRAVDQLLPADIAVCAAAVADWRVAHPTDQKLKKSPSQDRAAPTLNMVENPDILAALSRPGPDRPLLVVGFAAETENLIEHARAKLAKKGCDWICANDVGPASGTFDGDRNTIHLITRAAVENWPGQSKLAAARQLAARIGAHIKTIASSQTSGEAG